MRLRAVRLARSVALIGLAVALAAGGLNDPRSASAATERPAPTESPYIYPLTPERNEAAWVRAMDDGSLWDKLQVPADVIEHMSTSALLGAVLDYPLLIDVYARNSPQEGFDALRRQVRALDALLAREDVGTVVSATYADLDLGQTAATRPDSTIVVGFLELLVAQPEVLESLSKAERRDLVGVSASKWNEKVTTFNSEFYGTLGNELIAERALAIDDPTFAQEPGASENRP